MDVVCKRLLVVTVTSESEVKAEARRKPIDSALSPGSTACRPLTSHWNGIPEDEDKA